MVVIATVLLLAGLVWGTIKYPETLWAPGNLSRYHAGIADCRDCHQPFLGATADKCIWCHEEHRFVAGSKPIVTEFHQKWIREKKACLDCHTEHQGVLGQITMGNLVNPHGEFVFRATGAGSCGACHDFKASIESRKHLFDNAIVRRLMEVGEGAHQPGKMASCMKCHM